MSEIVFRLPAKQVQYGYVEVRATPEELGLRDLSDAAGLGAAYCTYVAAFLTGEAEGLKLVSQGLSRAAEPLPEVTPVGEPAHIIPLSGGSSDDMEAAADMLSTLGVTEIDENAAPWTAPPVAVQPKPWETGQAAPVTATVAEINW